MLGIVYNGSAYDIAGITGDDQFFIGGDDKDLYLGIRGGDHDVFAALAVGNRVDGDSEITEILADGSTGGLAVLTNTGRKDDGVNAIHCSNVGSGDLSNPVVEHIQGKLGALVALGSSVVKITEVRGDAGHAENARLLIEDVQHLINGIAVFVHEELDNTGVQIAAAGAHGQTDQRSKAHGGINALATINSRDGAAVTHMAGDDLQLFNGLAHKFCAAGRDIAVGRAVETIAAYAVILIILIGNSIHESLAGHGLMEGSIENGNHWDITHDLAAGIDAGNVGGVVQRRKGDAFFNCGHDIVIDQNGACKLLAAVNNPVTDSIDFLHGSNHAVFCGGKLLDNCGNGFGMSGQGEIFIEYRLSADKGAVLQMAINTNTLAKALCEDRFGGHIDQLVFQRRASGVDN